MPGVKQSDRKPISTHSSPSPSFIQFKLVMLGDMAVGKSSLALRFVRKEFRESQEPTIGAAFLTNTVSLDEDTQVLETKSNTKPAKRLSS